MILAGCESCSASYHLTVQRPYLCRTEHDHAIYGRAVPAFGKQHRVTEHVINALVEVCEYLCAVVAVSVDLCRPKALAVQNVSEFLRSLYQRQEYDCLSVLAVVHHFARDSFQIRVKSRVNVCRLVISRLCCYACHIDFERYRDRLYR